MRHHPATAVHPGAVAAAQRHLVPLISAAPQHIDDVLDSDAGVDDLIITVYDAAHEELAGIRRLPDPVADRLHWSIPDPARTGEDSAFDRVVTDLTDRIARVAPAVRPANPQRPTTGGSEAG